MNFTNISVSMSPLPASTKYQLRESYTPAICQCVEKTFRTIWGMIVGKNEGEHFEVNDSVSESIVTEKI